MEEKENGPIIEGEVVQDTSTPSSSVNLKKQPKLNQSDGYRSKLIAILLLIFIGGFGAHNFYLGRKSIAISQLIISVLAYVGVAIMIVTVLISPVQPDGSLAISNAMNIIIGSSLAIGSSLSISAWLIYDVITIVLRSEDNLGWAVSKGH